MLRWEGPYGHAHEVKKGGDIIREGVVTIPNKKGVWLFFFSKRDPSCKAGVVHLQARIVNSEVEVFKLSSLTLHANLSRVVPARVLWYKKFKQGVLPVGEVGRRGGIEPSLRFLTFF